MHKVNMQKPFFFKSKAKYVYLVLASVGALLNFDAVYNNGSMDGSIF